MSEPLHTFTTSALPSQQATALREMAQAKSLVQVAKGDAFEQGLGLLVKGLLHESADERLWACAALGRLWSSVKHQRESIEQAVSAAGMPEPSALQVLPDADDREYAAIALAWAPASWASAFLARGALHEEAGEKARKQCVASALHITRDLTLVLGLLKDGLTDIVFDTEKPADSMGRRVKRLLNALHETIGDYRLSAESAGKTLGSLMYESFRRTGAPASQSLRTDLVEATAEVVHDVVRARFAQATQPSTYDALDVASRWFRSHEWAEVATSVAPVRDIGEDIVEAIALLARAGVADDRMKSQLRVALGSDGVAAERLKALTSTLTGLTDEMRNWLAGTRPTVVMSSVEESAARGIEQIVAAVLVCGDGVSRDGQAVSAIAQIADLRCLELAGAVGDVVEYSPLDHQLTSGGLGVRVVRVLEPQVRAREGNGRFRVVRKALVQPASGAE